MKNTKRLLSMLLAILMVLGVCPLAIFADGEVSAEPEQTPPSEPKPYYTYYVQDGLTFLWSGEDLAIGETEQKVSALANILNPEQSINKMTYGRQLFNLAKNDGNGNAIFNPMSFTAVNGGVLVPSDRVPILTDIIPYTVIDDVEVLTDMTLEVSQSYFDKIATATGKTYSANRGHDGGSIWYGPLGSIGNGKMTYKSVVVGTTRYFYAEYKDASGNSQPFYFNANPKTATNKKYTYDGEKMTEITDSAVLALIHEQANANALTVDGTARSFTYSGNDYAAFPAIDGHGTAGVYVHNRAPLSTKSYDRAGQAQFLNNTINEAFTTAMIFDYAAAAKETTFTFTVGRDGVAYAPTVQDQAYNAATDYSVGTKFTGTTGTYNGVTYTKNETFLGFVGEKDANHTVGDNNNFKTMIANAIADEGRNFAFTYGTNIAFVMHAIRLYNRPLTSLELAQNHFVDIAMKLGADLSALDAILAREDAATLLPIVYAITSGADEGDFDRESFKQAIADAVTEFDEPKYADLYVKDGLEFFWLGEGNELGENKASSAFITNALNPEESLNKRTNGREKYTYLPSKTPSFYQIDNGVLFASEYSKLILNDFIPTRTLANSKIALGDMTLEVAQAYPEYYKTYENGTPTLNTRGHDGGTLYFGPVNASYTKAIPNGINVKGSWYAPFTYTNPDDNTDQKTVYVPSFSSAPVTFPYYDYNAETGKLTELGQLTRIAGSDAAVANDPNNTASALSPTISTHGMVNSLANKGIADSYGKAPISSWHSIFGGYDAFGKPEFMNSTAGEIFTTTMVFDYDYAEDDLTSESYGYTMGIGRDGSILNAALTTGTYDVNTDYSVGGTGGSWKWSDDGSNFAFTYGISTRAVEYYSIRIYNRVLSEKEIAQNHFADLAFQLKGDVTAYLEASPLVKERINMAFASYAAADFTTESFNETLAELLTAKGFAQIGDELNIVSFDGFAGSLEYLSGVRAVFEANQELIAQFEASGTKVEFGILVSPTKDPSALSVSYDEDGTPVASEGAILRTAYKTDEVNNFFADSTKFALAVTNPANEITVHYDSEFCFRAYATLSDGTDSATFYADAEGPTFGKSTSFREIYRYLYMNGYSEYGCVKTYGEEIETLLGGVKAEMEALDAEMEKVNTKIDKIDEMTALHDAYFAKAPINANDPFVAYYYAYNAYAATVAIEILGGEIDELTSAVNEKITALEKALAGENPDADALELASILTAKFKNELAAAEAYEKELSEREGWITESTVLAYMQEYQSQNTEDIEGECTLNGIAPHSYTLVANEKNLYAAKTVANAFLYSFGSVLFVIDEIFSDMFGDEQKFISLQSNADMDFGTYAITVSENGNILLAGQGDNGAYHAAMAFLSAIDGQTEATVESKTGSYKENTVQTYAAESFLKADGTLDTESTGDLNVVFIGGSLTELGKSVWTQGVSDYLAELFPNKKVNHINSGVGGTNSEGAAARFCAHVAPHNPDIIFIEFTVNDDMNSFAKDRAQFRMESFLYQCSQLDKIPTVVYLHTPPATMPGSEIYNRWYKQAEYKEEWAEHYGVSTINIFDYSYGKFEKELAEGKTNVDYITWLDDYYGTLQDEVLGNNNKYGRYDVHGGYQLYKEAVIEALTANAAEILAPYRFMPYMHSAKTVEIERTYEAISHDDDMFTYSEEGWDVYYEYDASIHKSGYLRVPSGRWKYPFFDNGIHQGNGDEGASFSFNTTANTITFYYIPALNDKNKTISDDMLNYGGQFEIWVNGTKIHTINTGSSAVQPFFTSTYDLKNTENEEIEVLVKVTKATDAAAAYVRFSSIYLGYNHQ